MHSTKNSRPYLSLLKHSSKEASFYYISLIVAAIFGHSWKVLDFKRWAWSSCLKVRNKHTSLNKIFFSCFQNPFYVSENNFHWWFYYADCQWELISAGGFELHTYKNDDFYWPLALAVLKDANENRFTTAIIELLCTSDNLVTLYPIYFYEMSYYIC
jgi:hypothetical protein